MRIEHQKMKLFHALLVVNRRDQHAAGAETSLETFLSESNGFIVGIFVTSLR